MSDKNVNPDQAKEIIGMWMQTLGKTETTEVKKQPDLVESPGKRERTKIDEIAARAELAARSPDRKDPNGGKRPEYSPSMKQRAIEVQVLPGNVVERPMQMYPSIIQARSSAGSVYPPARLVAVLNPEEKVCICCLLLIEGHRRYRNNRCLGECIKYS